ncbi:hypothetical protein [Bacteroides acidifaciens]|uniref:hypothetical protein n=1 Tax=Bacteroides acidifaciens TaxID=85831 RepID=UPI0025883827|nr:hypothetical protein [Bacteroides acidifaciens]
MKTLSFLIAALFCITGLSAQNYNKYFTQNVHEKGMLYFIFPTDMESAKENTSKATLNYDFTYLDSQDSVALLSTCSTKNPLLIDSLHVVLPSGKQRSFPVERIFNEKKKNKWNSRTRCNIDFALWEEMYKNEQAYTLVYTSRSNTSLAFTDSPRKWKKNKNIIHFIQSLIAMNRK